jgi:uncharacterized protein YbjT (DUF2867 family)
VVTVFFLASNLRISYNSVKTEIKEIRQRSLKMRTALVLGGGGFIGRHVVGSLVNAGCAVTIGSRHAHSHAGIERLRLEERLSPDAWSDVVARYDVIINCVGILRERWRETYDAIHHRGPAALARACASAGVRFIHVSALGLSDTAHSRFIRSKLAGERAIEAAGGGYAIVRPSILDGEGGFGARWIRRVAQWPIIPLPGGPEHAVAPLHVNDLGDAIARLSANKVTGIVELGGPHCTMREYFAALRGSGRFAPWSVRIPGPLVRATAHLLDLVHLTPLSFGHVELMRRANVPSDNALPHLLARALTPVGSPSLVRVHRVGEPRFQT